MRSFIFFANPQIILGRSNQEKCGGRDMSRMGEERKVYRVLVGKPEIERQKERDHWEDQGVDGKMGSEWILWRLAGRV
jgi:hypothetical protein